MYQEYMEADSFYFLSLEEKKKRKTVIWQERLGRGEEGLINEKVWK